MKILIVGFGAIGKRHFSLLKERAEIAIVTQRKDVDARVFKSLDEALSEFKPEIVFVCNETHKHWHTTQVCLKDSRIQKVIVEKPLTDDLGANSLNLSPADQDRICVSYNFRFSPLLITLKEELKNQKIYDAVVNVGQDLDQWRDRKGLETYSADKSKGGGALRDLSHELDYMQWILGPLEKSFAHVEKCSDLTKDSEDLVHALLKTTRCPSIFLRLSYLDKDPIRTVRINTKEFTYELNFIKGYLSKNGKPILENQFFSATYPIQADKILKKDFSNFCTYQEAVDVMKLILKLEKS